MSIDCTSSKNARRDFLCQDEENVLIGGKALEVITLKLMEIKSFNMSKLGNYIGSQVANNIQDFPVDSSCNAFLIMHERLEFLK